MVPHRWKRVRQHQAPQSPDPIPHGPTMAMAHHGLTFLTDFGEEKAGELANDAVGKAVKQS